MLPAGRGGVGGVYVAGRTEREREGGRDGGREREMWIISCVISSPALNSLTLLVAAGPVAPW